MLTVWEAIKNRRSIRKFAPDDVPDDLVQQMLEAARLSPSGGNRQPWRFVVVRDREARKALKEICLGQKFIEEAPVDIVCFGDLEGYTPEARKIRRQEFNVSGVTATLSGRFADPDYVAYLDSQPMLSRQELVAPLMANTYIAIEHMVLMATALGLGTCWVGGFTDASLLNRLFGLPDKYVPVIVLPVGYPAGQLPPPRPRLSMSEILLGVQAKTKV